jgi:hypothetical protein
MLIAARYLVDRLRQPQSRADEVLALRRRLAAESLASQVGADEAAAAIELRQLRQELSRATAGVTSCRSCAVGHPDPHGHFAGGHCCGLRTADVFSDDEVAALRQAGTGPAELRLPQGDHAGCSFRGPTGCSLAAGDRPNLCLRYVCPDLARELAGRGDLVAIEALGAQMEAVYLRFVELRRQRLDRQELAELAGLSET